MTTVHKFHIHLGENILTLPWDYELLSVAEQQDRIQLWVKVDTKERRLLKVIIWVGTTGYALPDERLKFIGTVLQDNGAFVVHVFKQLERGEA